MADVVPFKVPPAEAIRFFEQKTGRRITWSYRDMAAEEHLKAFTVAKMVDTGLLNDTYDALLQALREGQTFEQFRANIEPKMRAKGWWGRVTVTLPNGTPHVIQLGSVHRLRRIFRTNITQALSIGQWERIQRQKAIRPWLLYQGILDSRIRPQHRLWHGTLLPVDHPWWDTHFPPNGYNCRCSVVQLSDGDIRRRGLTPTTDPDDTPILHDVRGVGLVTLPRGVDYGFDTNPGKAHQQQLDRGQAQRDARREALEAALLGALQGLLAVEDPPPHDLVTQTSAWGCSLHGH